MTSHVKTFCDPSKLFCKSLIILQSHPQMSFCHPSPKIVAIPFSRLIFDHTLSTLSEIHLPPHHKHFDTSPSKFLNIPPHKLYPQDIFATYHAPQQIFPHTP